MITQILPSVRTLKAGQKLGLSINADYPVQLEIYGYLTQYLPVRCVLYPKGPSLIQEQIPLTISAEQSIFTAKGFLEIRIIDAAGDFRTLDVPVRPR